MCTYIGTTYPEKDPQNEQQERMEKLKQQMNRNFEWQIGGDDSDISDDGTDSDSDTELIRPSTPPPPQPKQSGHCVPKVTLTLPDMKEFIVPM